METIELPGGRVLAYEVGGDPDGAPVLFQHGTGDSRLCRHPDDALTASLGVRLVTIDRPGVGGSTVVPGRSLLDWTPDVEAVADALGIGTFVVAGHSGGGPHTLAVAVALGERVTRVGLAAPLAPFDQPGTRAMVKDRDLKTIFALAHAKFLAKAVGRAEAKHYSKDIAGFVAHCATSWPGDRALFTDPAFTPMFEAEFLAALEQGGVGALDDMWAFLDWGFAVEDVTQPTELFVGTADDILDPAMSSRLADRLADATLHTWDDAGHYGVYGHWEPFLRSLV